jgi:hypothetical protein
MPQSEPAAPTRREGQIHQNPLGLLVNETSWAIALREMRDDLGRREFRDASALRLALALDNPILPKIAYSGLMA